MDIQKFLNSLLASQDLLIEQENSLQTHKKEVTDFLVAEFGNKPKIKYAGSREKGTMIRDSYDLDIVCYFPSTDTRSLKEIRQEVSDHLSQRYVMQDKASAERITNLKGAKTPESYHIDVVPGRFIEGSNDVFIHVAYGDKERMQTNLKTHIDHIAKSGCVPVIRLVKLWSVRNNVSIKTFILELFVVEVLKGSQNKGDLRSGFIKVMEALRDNFGSMQLVDPANSNNVVSRTIDSSQRVMVSHVADETLSKIEDSTNLSDWRAVFHEENDRGTTASRSYTPDAGPTIINNPSKPWAW
ncbi:MAG TPA: hypothetical protein VHE10_02560 [Candidatus Paceibacterota bacterium]|nr:hypothetical protein [Candidatus Paceibacterota bacterium]